MIFCASWDRNSLKQNLCQFVPKLCHHTSRQRELMEMDDHRWNWRFIRNWKYCPSESITDKNQYRFYVRQEWVKRQRFQAFYPFWQTAYLIPFDKQFIWSLLTNSLWALNSFSWPHWHRPTRTWRRRRGRDQGSLRTPPQERSRGRSTPPSRRKCRWTRCAGWTRSPRTCKLSDVCRQQLCTSSTCKVWGTQSFGKSHPSPPQESCYRVARISWFMLESYGNEFQEVFLSHRPISNIAKGTTDPRVEFILPK